MLEVMNHCIVEALWLGSSLSPGVGGVVVHQIVTILICGSPGQVPEVVELDFCLM